MGEQGHGPIAYEIVYDCRDRRLGRGLAERLREAVDANWEVRPVEEGPTWSLAIDFPSEAAAEEFFDSDLYREFCVETRRACKSSVLVVPLGPADQSGG